MNKADIIKAVLFELEEDLRRQLKAQESASAGATHVEAKAETKWDTCGLEQSYLARGHAQQFESLVKQIEDLRAFCPPDFSGMPIGLGALIEAEMGGEKMCFILLKCGGGLDVEINHCMITVITPESPLGASLLEKEPGDKYVFRDGVEGMVLSVN